MVAQSSIFPIFLRAEYREDGQGFSRFQSEAQRAANQAKAEFRSVGTVIDEALGRQRNATGSLDLGVNELREAAAAQRARAIAANEVAAATARLAPIQAKEGVSLRVSAAATRNYANEQDRLATELEQQIRLQELVQQELNQTASATDMVTQAARRGTTARGSVINSARAERTAFIQLGQQMQDMTVQAQMGTNAFIIFGQQMPQVAFALSGLESSANKTKAAVGRFATFMAGPFGALVFVGIAVLGPLVQMLLASSDAADKSGDSQRALADVLMDSASSYDEVTRALREYNAEQERSREVTLLSLNEKAAEISANLRVAASIREKTKALLEDLQSQAAAGMGAAPEAFASISSTALGDIARQDALIAELTAAAGEVTIEVATAIAEVNTDASRRIREGFAVLRKEAKESISDVDELTARLTQLNRAEAAALQAEGAAGRGAGRSGRAGAERASREQEQLARFSEQAAEQIQRVNERFDEQTRLVDQTAQATRQLDRIIKELSERKPAGFQELIDQAEKAKITVEEALVRPFELLREESQNRLKIEEALAAGRVDEAAALQEIFRIEQQLGPLSRDRRDEIRDIVAFEQQRIRFLRDQQALFEAQLDVVQTVRRDLTAILSGRNTDFFGNFRQALQDLQGQRLFESLFGDSFRAIEEELRGNTPQGRANAAFTANVNEVGVTTKQLETSLDGLTNAVDRTRDRLLADFDNEFGAANDNLPGTPGEIFVNGRREQKVELVRRSTKEIADEIGKATVAGFLAPFEDLLGTKFFNGLSVVLGNVLSAFVRGGEAGAVLQGLSEVAGRFKGGEGLSKVLGEAVAGAETGTQIDGLIKALGIKGSRTGAQIGGAAGAATGIPGGAQLGAIAGSIIGGLLKGTPRGSATIGGVGAELGVTGTRGNSGRRREAAGGLAGNVLEAIDSIAQQLGASVSSARGAVSIGVRNDDIRVDPTGRGITKTSKGAIDFGDDSEAAIAFAVRDLINDGVITGLRQSEENLLRAGKDIEAALRDVLTFRSVFDRLQEIRDPLGFAIDQLNKEFSGLIDLFERAGASTEEFADLEELYNLERARAIEDATDRVVGSLRQLLSDLTIGDSGLSLRDRRSNALGQFNDLAGRVAAGDATAFDDFADISQQLLDIERQLFGSTQSYFDRLAQITALTEQAIADQTNVTSIAANSPSPFADRVEVNRSIDIMNDNLGGKLDTLNHNILAFLNATDRSGFVPFSQNGFTSPLPRLVANF